MNEKKMINNSTIVKDINSLLVKLEEVKKVENKEENNNVDIVNILQEGKENKEESHRSNKTTVRNKNKIIKFKNYLKPKENNCLNSFDAIFRVCLYMLLIFYY